MPNMGKRILLVDDDEQLTQLLSMKLRQAGYSVKAVNRPSIGYSLALHNAYDVIVLDMVMPLLSGTEVCRSLRAHGNFTPVLMLSGRAEKAMIVQGLSAGADDYLTKPFSSSELDARLQALIRRNKRMFNTQSIEKYDIILDVFSGVASNEQHSIALTRKETLLLKRLMSEAPNSIARQSLLEDVWGIGAGNASNRLDVYIRRLRSKMKTLCGSYRIRTIRGSGYYFDKT